MIPGMEECGLGFSRAPFSHAEPAGLDKDLMMNILWANIKTGSATQPPSSLSESRHSVRMKGNDLSPHCDAQQSELDQEIASATYLA
jgi:hypothetical protein